MPIDVEISIHSIEDEEMPQSAKLHSYNSPEPEVLALSPMQVTSIVPNESISARVRPKTQGLWLSPRTNSDDNIRLSNKSDSAYKPSINFKRVNPAKYSNKFDFA